MHKTLPALILTALIFLTMGKTVPAHAAEIRYSGIDVSKYEGSINWQKAKNSGVQFAMIRTGYGGDAEAWNVQTDPYFETNYAGATNVGLKVGVYHYSYATSVSMAEEEADFCLHILNGRHLDYPIAYDVEDPRQTNISAANMAQIVQAFCGRIQQAGYKAIVYSYVTFYNSRLTDPLVSQYDTWIANYTKDSAPRFSRSYTMWQYTSSGSVPGISGACDMDYSYVDYSDCGGTSNPSNSPAPSSVPLDAMMFQSDTSSYSFGGNSTYIYKITTADTCPPTAVSSNPSSVTVSPAKATTNGFLFVLTNVGLGQATITTTAGDGIRSVSFTAEGSNAAQATSLQSDTSAYTFGSSKAYYYKITTDASTPPSAASSDSSVAAVSYVQRVPGGYLYKITDTGTGTAVITTSSLNGMSVSFQVNG